MILRISSWLFLFFWGAFMLIYRLLICFSYRPELCNGESNNVWKILNVSNGHLMYSNPEKMPFEVFQYTPLSQIPVIVLNYFVSPNSINYLYYSTVLGRCYELLINILMCVIIYNMLLKVFNFSRNTALFVCLLVASNFTQTVYTIRPDSTLLFLLVLTTYYYLKNFKLLSTSWLKIGVLGVLFSLCFITKQDGIVLSIPIALHLLYIKEYKVLIKLSIISLVTLLVEIVISDFIFGKYFLFSILNGINNPSSLGQAIIVFIKSITFFWHVFFIGIFISIYSVLKPKDEKILLISLLSLFYFDFGFLTTMKNGSWVNYYIPSILFFIILIFIYFRLSLKTLFFMKCFLFVGSIIFLFNQVFNYTSPFLKKHNDKQIYYSTFHEIANFKRTFKVDKKVNVLIVGYLERNFLFENSIMVNTEYYCNSKFNYSDFQKSKTQNVDYIVFKESDKNSLIQLINFFELNLDFYQSLKYRDYVVLKKDDKKIHSGINIQKLIELSI